MAVVGVSEVVWGGGCLWGRRRCIIRATYRVTGSSGPRGVGAAVVRDRHAGRQTHYSAHVGALAPLIDWTNRMSGFWQSRFDSLEDLLKRMDQ